MPVLVGRMTSIKSNDMAKNCDGGRDGRNDVDSYAEEIHVRTIDTSTLLAARTQEQRQQ